MGKHSVISIAWSLPVAFLVCYTVYLKYFVPIPSIDYGTGNMFDKIAPRYDFVNRVLALNMDISWRKQMVHEIVEHVLQTHKDRNPKTKEEETIHIVDLATGTADVALILAETLDQLLPISSSSSSRPNVKITGIDPSSKMIFYGQSKVVSSNMEQVISLRIGDSRNLRDVLPTDSSVDAITMAFGMRNVPPEDREQALCEFHRVLKKQGGGKLAILEFSEPGPNHGVLGFIAKQFIRHIVPSLGALLSGASREYIHLQNSIDQFPTPTQFVETMEHVRCGRTKKGAFQVEKLQEMNFGSVQLYVAAPIVM